jgi:Flp pilus assembly protein TadD
LREYQAAVTLNPADASAYRDMAAVLTRMGRYAQAEDSLGQALNCAPHDPITLSQLGALHAIQGDLEKAVTLHTKALKLDEEYATGHFNLGLALVDSGQMDQAIEHFRRAVELDPEDKQFHEVLEKALRQTGPAP